MSCNKKISIILPTYNGSAYLRNSIESVLRQTYINWELIVVNDCSTDDTENIVNEYIKLDTRIKLITNEKNMKLPASLNIGFKHATGDYFSWTSDDNMYRPDALSTLSEYLDTNENCSLVYSNYMNIDENGSELFLSELPEPSLLVRGNTVGASFLYRRSVAQKAGQYDTNLFLAEDYDYWVQLSRYGELHHINNDLYCYRRHSQSLSETKKKKVEEQEHKVFEKNFYFLYTKALKEGLEYMLFDSFIRSSDETVRDSVLKQLISINKGYKFYLLKQKIGAQMRDTLAWKLARKVKGFIFRT